MFVPSAVTNLYWMAFLASIITGIIAKLFGAPWNIFFLFAVSYISWIVGLLLLIMVSNFLSEKRTRKK